jgi:hypothetical protein
MLKKRKKGPELCSFDAEWEIVAGCFEHGDEISLFIKCEEFIDKLNNYYVLMETLLH